MTVEHEGSRLTHPFRCPTCMFWTGDANGRVGDCRRDGPVHGPQGYAEWPKSRDDQWCGEHAEWIPAA